jgi:hypothetical protein
VLLGDRHSEAAALFGAVAAKYCKELISAARRFLEHAPESGGVK